MKWIRYSLIESARRQSSRAPLACRKPFRYLVSVSGLPDSAPGQTQCSSKPCSFSVWLLGQVVDLPLASYDRGVPVVAQDPGKGGETVGLQACPALSGDLVMRRPSMAKGVLSGEQGNPGGCADGHGPSRLVPHAFLG